MSVRLLRNLRCRIFVIALLAFFLGIDAYAAGPRILRLLDGRTGEPIVGATVTVKGWNHSSLIIIRGRYIDPRCCSIAKTLAFKTDSSGQMTIPADSLKKDFTLLEISTPEQPSAQLLFRTGRPAALTFDRKEFSGREFEKLLISDDRTAQILSIRLPRK